MEENQTSPTPEPIKEKKGCSPILVVILAILALGGIGFGIFELLNKPKENIADCNCPTCEQAEQQPKTTEAETTANANDYFYISEWGIKVKKPEGLNIFNYHVKVKADDVGPWYEKAEHIYIEATSELEYDTLQGQDCSAIVVARMRSDESKPIENANVTFDGYSYIFELGGSPCALDEESYPTKEDYERALEAQEKGGKGKLIQMFSNIDNYEKI